MSPGGLEHPLKAVGGDLRDHAVEGLAVEVHHPQDLAEPRDGRVGDRLPARPLVELGVADEGYLPPGRRRAEMAPAYRFAAALQIGAVAPRPTDPVEKSTG